MIATATFDVTGWEPAESDAPEAGPELSRVTITKTFTGGDLAGTSRGDGLFCGMSDPSAGAGYLVSERFVGRLGERSGSFVLQHGGLMGPGLPPRTFGSIVPGSGTGDMTGISGQVEIHQDEEGTHTLRLDYQLPT